MQGKERLGVDPILRPAEYGYREPHVATTEQAQLMTLAHLLLTLSQDHRCLHCSWVGKPPRLLLRQLFRTNLMGCRRQRLLTAR